LRGFVERGELENQVEERQNANKFGIVFGLFVHWLSPKILRLGIIKLRLASALDFSYL